MAYFEFLHTSLSELLAFSTLLVVIYNLTSVIYNLYFSPLAKVPGPFWAKISSWPSFYHTLRRDRHVWILQNFEQFGDTFRATPTLVLFNSPKAYRDIYSNKANVKKHITYDSWKTGKDTVHVLNCTDVELHAKKRRILNVAFTDNAIRSAVPFVIGNLDRWNELSAMTGEGDGGWSAPVDLSEWTSYLVFDILGDLLYGRSFKTIEPGDNPYKVMPKAMCDRAGLVQVVSKFPMLKTILLLRPYGLWRLEQFLAPKSIKEYYAFVTRSVNERLTKDSEAQKGHHSEDADKNINQRKDILHYLIHAAHPDDSSRPAYSKIELLTEANLLTIAGSDTTATTICGLFFYLTHPQNSHVYAKLTSEIRSAFAAASDIVDGPTLSNCKYLRACIDEAMRLAPAVPSELPRTVLRGGTEIDGESWPEGTDVGASLWANGHSRAIYGEDVNVFRPERWIAGSEEEELDSEEKGGGETKNTTTTTTTAEDVARIKACFHPFSTGPGNCAGRNLARLELLLVVARTLWRLDMRRAEGFKHGRGERELEGGEVQYLLGDVFVADRFGPVVQFRKRGV